MNEVFRFMTIRPPEAVDPDEPRFMKLADSGSKLQDALAKETALEKMSDLCRKFVTEATGENGTYVSSLKLLSTPIETFGARLSQTPSVDADALPALIREVFGQDATDLVKDPQFTTDRRNIADSIVALTITHQEGQPVYDKLVDAMRLCRLVERSAESDTTLQLPGAIMQALNQLALLPDRIFPLPGPQLQSETASQPPPGPGIEEAVMQRLANLQLALEELDNVKASDFRSVEPLPGQPETEKSDATAPVSASLGRDTSSTVPGAWILSKAALDRLQPSTKEVVASLGIALDATPLPELTNVLERNLIKFGAEVYKPVPPIQMVRIGSTWLPAAALSVAASSTTEPVNAGAAKEIGVADLDMVKQELQRYEAGEIAHIENVLRGEKKERSHRRTTRTEETIFTETETTEETERDLQSTERFELERETQKTQKEETAFDAGVTVKYGGVVDIEASSKFAMKNASEESARTASKYGRDVTERSVNRIRERVLERRTRTTIEEIEEKNLHGVDNTNSDDHVVGIYRWVDKTYKAQVFNYGLRTMYEFIIPEPAVFTLYAQANEPPAGVVLAEPQPPVIGPWEWKWDPSQKKWVYVKVQEQPLKPEDINFLNYQKWMAQYHVANVDPPPPEYVTTAHVFDGRAGQLDESGTQITRSALLDIPSDYAGLSGWVQMDYNYWTSEEAGVSLVIGKHSVFNKGKGQAGKDHLVALADEIGKIPITVKTWATSVFTIAVEVLCRLSDKARMAWKIKVFEALMQGYLDLKSKYDEQLTVAQIDAVAVISGRNPALNREVEQAEMKKGAIILLTQKWQPHLDGVGAIDAAEKDGKVLPPKINFAKANQQASLSQFLEQAFEWTQMVYTFYPYFWARKDLWPVLQQIDDNDPMHARFLRAGAARVLVPVRPGYENSVRHYWATGKPWEGKGSPSVVDGAFLPIVEEIKEQQGQYSTKGQGTLSVTQGSAEVTGAGTVFSHKDVGREIFVEGFHYEIASVVSSSQITLTNEYAGATNEKVAYSLGMKAVGEPWLVKIPTSLVILQKDAELPDFTKNAQGEEFHADTPLPRLVVGKRGRVRLTNKLPERVRLLPGLAAKITTRWKAGIEFKVIDGPVYKDGYLWWLVDNSVDRGWCAEGVIGDYYLEPLEQDAESSKPAVG